MDELKYMDYDTYNQVIGGSLEEFEEFKKEYSESLEPKIQVEKQIEKNVEKKQINKSEEYEYTIALILLEMSLPRYEIVYGEFKYSKDNITDKQKYMELIKYFEEVCGVSEIKNIIKENPRRRKK